MQKARQVGDSTERRCPCVRGAPHEDGTSIGGGALLWRFARIARVGSRGLASGDWVLAHEVRFGGRSCPRSAGARARLLESAQYAAVSGPEGLVHYHSLTPCNRCSPRAKTPAQLRGEPNFLVSGRVAFRTHRSSILQSRSSEEVRLGATAETHGPAGERNVQCRGRPGVGHHAASRRGEANMPSAARGTKTRGGR